MNHNFSHSFLLLRKKSNKKGLAPVYARINCNNEFLNLSTKVYVDPKTKNWQQTTGRFKTSTIEGKNFNKQLESFEKRLENLYDQISSTYEHYSIASLKHHINTPIQSVTSLIELCNHHLNHVEELIGRKYVKGTWRHYKSSRDSLQTFLIEKLKVKDIPIEKLSDSFVLKFESFLATSRGNGKDTIGKECKRLKRALRYGMEMGWVKTFPFPNHKSKSSTASRHPLTAVQLSQIEKLTVEGGYRSLCKDLFLFASYTGLAYQDIMSFSSKDIMVLQSGRRIISKERGKTGNISELLLSPKAEELILKYSHNPASLHRKKIFPYVSNKTFNDHLKIIAKQAEIEANLTTHIGRHTFATLALENGMPMETLSKALGHNLIKTTQQYGKITRLKIEKDFLAVEANSLAAA